MAKTKKKKFGGGRFAGKSKDDANSKTKSVDVPKDDLRLFITIHCFFGFFALLCIAYSGFLAWEFATKNVDPREYESAVKALISALYYPMFYFIGFIVSHNAFRNEKYLTAILSGVIIPIAPVGVALMMYKGI